MAQSHKKIQTEEILEESKKCLTFRVKLGYLTSLKWNGKTFSMNSFGLCKTKELPSAVQEMMSSYFPQDNTCISFKIGKNNDFKKQEEVLLE
jgi:hypothetical protein